jgi:hypothetical protein
MTKKSPHEISSDGTTVWVNAPVLVGRFSKFGIDIHRLPKQQAELGQCLLCTHELPTQAQWTIFKDKMREFYGIKVPDKHKPTWLSVE